MLKTQPLYGTSLASVPKSLPEDAQMMTELLDIITDPDNHREVILEGSKFADAKKWHMERKDGWWGGGD